MSAPPPSYDAAVGGMPPPMAPGASYPPPQGYAQPPPQGYAPPPPPPGAAYPPGVGYQGAVPPPPGPGYGQQKNIPPPPPGYQPVTQVVGMHILTKTISGHSCISNYRLALIDGFLSLSTIHGQQPKRGYTFFL